MVTKRSITLAGHRTSLSLEEPFWEELHAIAKKRNISLAALVAEIDTARMDEAIPSNLSSALRVFVVNSLKSRARP